MIDTNAVRRLFAEAGIETPIPDDESLFDTGVIDSIMLIDVVEKIHETYRINITDDDLNEENFGSISSIAKYLVEAIGGQT